VGASEHRDCCSEIKVAIDRTKNIDSELKEHESINRGEFSDVWAAINGIRNRLPNWATIVISILMFLLGTFATIAFKGGTA